MSAVNGSGPLEVFLAKAMQTHQAGQIAEAQEMLRSFLNAVPNHPEALHLLGVTWCQLDQPDRGLPYLKQAVAGMPGHAAARNSLGNALRALNRYRDALGEYEKAVALMPGVAVVHYNRGAALAGLARHDEAIACYLRALALEPGYADAHNNLGNSLGALGRHDEAIAQYRKALALAPDSADTLTNLGVALGQLGRNEEALLQHDRALAIRPGFAKALCNRGNALSGLKRHAEAIACFEQSLALDPHQVEARNVLGVSLSAMNRHEDAIVQYEKALSINRRDPEIHNNYGTALVALNRHDTALQRYDKALALKPDFALAEWNKSLALLTQGKFAQGFKLYEQRWRSRTIAPLADFGLPVWLGRESIAGRNLLVQAEQGLGDAIQMLRYVPLLEAAGAICWLQLPAALAELAQRSFPNARVVLPGQAPAGADCRIPIMSLPLAMRTAGEGDIPRNFPYLHAEPGQVAHWGGRLASSGKLLTGLVWRGAAAQQNDHNRSMPLASLVPLLARGDIQFVTLQKDLGAPERALLASCPNVTCLDQELTSLDVTAAVMSALDLVISVDSAPAHLAAALGRPTHILLAWSPDWRWLLGCDASPWYPDAMLHRQHAAGQWAPAVAALASSI